MIHPLCMYVCMYVYMCVYKEEKREGESPDVNGPRGRCGEASPALVRSPHRVV
ncbi:hypothetical protein HanIR_Chr14g0696151 [Helianthus annuus]|nr:hypothetical protein HanIR_Chr14g0696151 [Helianthus annuus]